MKNVQQKPAARTKHAPRTNRTRRHYIREGATICGCPIHLPRGAPTDDGAVLLGELCGACSVLGVPIHASSVAAANSAPTRTPTAADWKKAERIATGTLRRDYPGLFERASDIAKAAVDKASRKWRGTASFSSYATRIALNAAAKIATREIRAKQPPKLLIRRRAKPGEASALNPVFVDLIAHVARVLDDAPYGTWRGQLGRLLRVQILSAHLEFLLDHYKVRPVLRPKLTFSSAFDARVDAFADVVFGEWEETPATVDARLRGVSGRMPRDPYRVPDELAGDEAVDAYLSEMKVRHLPLRFDEKRASAVEAVLRFALSEAGYGGTVLNVVLGPSRQKATRTDQKTRRKAMRTKM